jgi:hypothetical protein
MRISWHAGVARATKVVPGVGPNKWYPMETTEKIVESYGRNVKQWFTIPKIKCAGQYEVDLLAVNTTSPRRLGRYHIERGASISDSESHRCHGGRLVG